MLTLALRRHAARTRCCLWMIASAKFLIPFSLLIASGQWFHSCLGSTASQPAFSSAVASMEQPLLYASSAAATATTATHALAAVPASVPVDHPLSVLWLLVAVWAAGAIFLLARWARSWWSIRRALRSSDSIDLPFPFPVRVVATRMEPGVFGIFCPVLLLPSGLVDHLKPAQLDAILAHELCHIRRRDNLYSALHMIVETLFWFHPAVWWIRAQLLEERERACDEAVLASRSEAVSYAEGILNVCKFYVEAPSQCVAGVTGSDLKKRIARVMSQHRERPLGKGMKVVLTAAALVAVGLPLSFGMVRPVQAQAKPDHSIVGTWQGTLQPPHRSLRVVLKVKKTSAGKLTADFYSIDQRGQAIPTSFVRFKNSTLKYAIQSIDVNYTGKMSADGISISGSQTQMGHSLPLVFERATAETAWTIPSRPHVAPMAATANPGIEVSTVKPTKQGTRMRYLLWRGNQLTSRNFTLTGLIKFAYGVQSKQIIGGPSWMRSDKFDIDAKPNVPGAPTPDQMKDMVKHLLAARFHLKIHNGHKEMSAYVLTVAKSGAKMTKNNSHGAKLRLMLSPPIMTLHAYDATMSDFAHGMQAIVLDRPVVNDTGLAGRWNFSLHWTPDATQFDGRKMPAPSKAESEAPPLSTAIREQLGLKMGTEKTSIPVLVIDHVNHPSPN